MTTEDFNSYSMVLTADDVAEILGIGKNSTYDLLRNGEISGFKKKRRWFVPRSAIEKFINDNAYGSNRRERKK